VSTFEEMYQNRQFQSWRDFHEVKRMLSEAIRRGFVEEIPVSRRSNISSEEKWYRDKETVVYSLVPPDPRRKAYGWGLISKTLATTSTMKLRCRELIDRISWRWRWSVDSCWSEPSLRSSKFPPGLPPNQVLKSQPRFIPLKSPRLTRAPGASHPSQHSASLPRSGTRNRRPRFYWQDISTSSLLLN